MAMKMAGVVPPLGGGVGGFGNSDGRGGSPMRAPGLPNRIPSAGGVGLSLPTAAVGVKRPPSAAPAPPVTATAAAAAAAIHPLLPPLPANVHLNPAVTNVSVVPLAGSDKAIPALSPSEISAIQAWQQVDRDYEGIWRATKERMAEEVRGVMGPAGAAWWEKEAVDGSRRRPRESFDVKYPRQRKEVRGGRRAPKREGLRL